MNWRHKITLDRVKIMEQAISIKVQILKNVLSSYFYFNFFIKICINLIKALVVFTISISFSIEYFFLISIIQLLQEQK